MPISIPSTEIISEEDYKKVEVLGLLPTDRDPSAWLRMVARVFAAYKGVDVTKSISAYIDGFHILNSLDDIKNHNPGYYTFIIEKGACFIDDQFIGFKDNVLVKFPKLSFLPGHEYWIVLQYNWLMQADYPLAKFEVIPPDLFVEGEMLKIRGFRITTAGDIELLPEDLDDQFAQNFKKIFDLASEKVIDSLDSIKFQYVMYTPEENKIDPSCKSGDFVYLDYITGTYKPARSCTKRLDKAVGLYLKDITNNNDYIIHGGFVDFGNPRWKIDSKRIYLKNLEPGAEYYLADNCVIGDPANPFYDDTLQMESTDPGKISTKFYPGLVRVGYAVDHDKMYVQLDYTSEIDVQNILELFGDRERFDIRYQDYYRYYALLAEQEYIIDKLANENSLISDLVNEVEDLTSKITNQEITVVNNYNQFDTQKTAVDNSLNTDIFSESNKESFSNIFLKYSYNIQYHQFNYNWKNIFNEITVSLQNFWEILDEIHDNLDDTDSDSILYKSRFTNYSSTSDIKNIVQNFKADCGSLANLITYLEDIVNSSSKVNINDSRLNISISGLDSLLTQYTNYTNKSVSTSTFKNYLDSIYKLDSGNETGYLITILKAIDNIYYNMFFIDIQNLFFKLFDISNYNVFSYTFSIDNIRHTFYKVDRDLNTNLIFDRSQNENDTTYSLISGTDYNENSTEDTISGTYTASQNITNYIDPKFSNYIKKSISKFLQIANKLSSIIYYLISVVKTTKDFLDIMSATESNINNTSNDYNSIETRFNNIESKTETLLSNYQDLQISVIDLYRLKKQKEAINNYLSKLSQTKEDLINRNVELNEEITNLKNALGKDLDFNIPTLSIFMINNYQRIIYNYTYITNRLKIKYKERKVIEDRIEIARNARTEVLSKVPVNKALDEQLKYIIDSYQALLDEINNEITTLTDEYNKIRTTYLGLDPIAHDDPNFDDGGYAVFDLDCLDTVE